MPSYSAYDGQPIGTPSGTGLDQVLGWIARDPGLAGANEGSLISAGIAAANNLNTLLIAGLEAIGAGSKSVLTYVDIVALNGWIRGDATRLADFMAWHGNDEAGVETGFHQIQGDGGNTLFDGKALIDTVLDGIYHIGFPISADATRLTNEDGTDNATIADVARWLTALKDDLATTGSELDRIVETVMGDPGLQAALSWADIQGGADAANRLNSLILQGLGATSDGDPTRISADEVRAINSWIRSDSNRLNQFIADHGDDETGVETGFHLVQNDGATTRLFGQNAVNTIFDGVFHIGFEINADGRFVNEDGNANAAVGDVAEWLTYYYGDPSTTGSGLDQMTEWMRLDPGLGRSAPAKDINDGLAAANDLNQLLLDAIDATDVDLDGWISRYDLREINAWVQENQVDQFILLHGDDETGVETGFHLIQNDGGSTQFFGRNLINTVADGIYHYGFQITGENFLNEDGNTNQSLTDVSGWLNYFLSDSRLTIGTSSVNDTIVGSEANDQVLAYSGDDVVDGRGGSDLLDGGWGKDSLRGGSANDLLDGGFNDDWLDGGDDDDTYLVSGSSIDAFQGYDTYADSGISSGDTILAEGMANVDIGLRNFGTNTGIDQIVNQTQGNLQVRLLGNAEANSLNFSTVQLVGENFVMDAGSGNDTVTGSSANDKIFGGSGNDNLNGANGSDTYEVGGSMASGFQGYDTYADNGSDGAIDRIIVTTGAAPIDIGITSFSAASGIETIDASATSGNVRLLADSNANSLNFTGITLIGSNLAIDSASGNDTVTGSSANDKIFGGSGNDNLNGANGSDTYEVGGSMASGFQGYDTYADNGSDGAIDRIIVTTGAAPIDIGITSFSAASGIETIDASATSGNVRLLADSNANSLNFTGITLIGSNLAIDSASGNDTVTGSSANDKIFGGSGNDNLNGANGSDTYEVGGSMASGFQGYDTYADNGSDGAIDRIIVTTGAAPIDIGITSFSAASGIETIDASATSGNVRLLADSNANSLNFTGITLIGSNLAIDSASGNDTVTGSSANDKIFGGSGNDNLNGANGSDTIIGGSGLDTITGGDGADNIVYTSLLEGIVGGSTSARTFEKIGDFSIGLDNFDLATVPASGTLKTLGAVSGLTNGAITTLLSTTNFVANGAATFTFGTGGSARTFVAFNDATAGYNAATDAVLEITGYTYASGFSSLSQIGII